MGNVDAFQRGTGGGRPGPPPVTIGAPSWNPGSQILNFEQATFTHKRYPYLCVAYKNNAVLMVLKSQPSSTIKDACTSETAKLLSRYTRAAKMLFKVNTSATTMIATIRKCL